MDQSGPRHSPPLKSPIIERADLQTRGQRTLYGVLTVGFWLFWIYLWVPVLALLAWLLGVQQAYEYMVVLEGWRSVAQMLGFYALIILLLGGALLAWAGYNILRFGGADKRTAPLPVTTVDIGRHFGKEEKSVARWQSERRLYVAHDDDGQIDHVEALVNGAAVPI